MSQDEVDALRDTLKEEQASSLQLARAVLGWWSKNSTSLDDPEMVVLAERVKRRLNGDGER